MTATKTDIDLSKYRLAMGGHDGPEQGTCLMELVALLAGEIHSHFPDCTSAVLADYAVMANDNLPDGPRQELIVLAQELIGTACPRCENRRLDAMLRHTLANTVEKPLEERAGAAAAAEFRRLVASPGEQNDNQLTDLLERHSNSADIIPDNSPLEIISNAHLACHNAWQPPPDPYTAITYVHNIWYSTHHPDDNATARSHIGLLRHAIAVCPHGRRHNT